MTKRMFIYEDLILPSQTQFVPKGWGYELWLANVEKANYCAKILFVAKDKRCSWHYHPVKDETFFVQSGRLDLHQFDIEYIKSKGLGLGEVAEKILREASLHPTWKIHTLNKGDAMRIPPGTLHMFHAMEDTLVIEASTFHQDEDSIRLLKGD